MNAVTPDSDALSSGLSMRELGARIRGLRLAAGYSLADLAEASGVSRSMVSEIERGTKTPGVLTLDKLATSLGTSIARLLDQPVQARVHLLRHADQRVVRDPDGWERRILSPVLPGIEFEFMRTTIDPGVDAGEFLPHAPGSREYVAIETGTLHLTLDGSLHVLRAGDAIYYPGDCRHGFRNEGESPCIYYLAMELATSHVRHTPSETDDAD